jgi:hypothetical protein
LVAPAIDAIDRKIDWLIGTLEEVEARIRGGDDDATIVQRVLGGEDLAAVVSRGGYSRRNFVRAIRVRLAI